jgi:hypothetical protein
MDQQATIRAKFETLAPVMDERMTRLWVAAEARALGPGGPATVARATGIGRARIRSGLHDLEELSTNPPAEHPSQQRIRRPGGGRKRLTETDPTLLDDLESLVEPLTRGDPESPLRWTCKSTRNLAAELVRKGHQVGATKVGYLLWDIGYRLHANAKTLEGKQHPDRDAQFEHINEQVESFLARHEPVISVDTKKKELVGDFKNGGREWEPIGEPTQVNVHDFPTKAHGKAVPYGVYDLGRNEGWVSVGMNHDTAELAVESIRRWWRMMGHEVYPNGKELLITADAGGSNSYRTRLWKTELQDLANETGLSVTVCHFPPGTSKWNKIEHRLFSAISQNWRGRPLVSHQVVVDLIGATRTSTGLRVRAGLDAGRYEKGIKVTDAEMRELVLQRANFHGEWNYRISPQNQ